MSESEGMLGPAVTPAPASRTACAQGWRLLQLAGGLLALHGVIELLPLLGLFGPLQAPAPAFMRLFVFQELTRSPQAVAGVSAANGLLRIVAAVGVLSNRQWGWFLAVVMSAVTLGALTFYLPFGLGDAVLTGCALCALVIGRYGTTKIMG